MEDRAEGNREKEHTEKEKPDYVTSFIKKKSPTGSSINHAIKITFFGHFTD